MHTIDNEKFGLFLVQLRKEKGMTQKELAEKLYVSDKAVSKWERGLSLPDISLLQPMAELLDVTVTELLSGRRIPADQPLTIAEVEPLVTGRLVMNAQELEKQREHRWKWGKWFFLALAAFTAEMLALWRLGFLWDSLIVLAILPPLMACIFGVHFIFGAKEKLPSFYDKYPLSFYSDSAFQLSIPGVRFNNRNWPFILNTLRMWACLTLGCWVGAYTLLRWGLAVLELPVMIVYFILFPLTMFVVLGGMFIPVYVVGKNYE